MDVVGICEFFRSKLWYVDWQNGERLIGCSLKVEPTGYLAILKFISAEGPKVGFCGGKTIEGVFRTLSSDAGRKAIKLREDQYALDKK